MAAIPAGTADLQPVEMPVAIGHLVAHALHAHAAVALALGALNAGSERHHEFVRRRDRAGQIGAGHKPFDRCLPALTVTAAVVFHLHPRLRGAIEQGEA
ncbi:MAG: hypothetical protein U0587_15800 [Candidatus Binatia bacterium]